MASVIDRPNIILILADDIGVETIQSYGGESYLTPRLDQLADEGMRFENAHAQPLCTPSRVKLMTGKYNFRNYQQFMYLDPNETTFAHVLRRAGYKTMVSGKWQLVDNGFDSREGAMPSQAGFDDYFLWQVRRKEAGSRYWSPSINHNGERSDYSEQYFGPDLFNNYVLDYMEANADTPFFIYYTMALPHLPFVTTPDSLTAKTQQEKFSGMITYMDKLVGKVRDQAVALGIDRNTLILFVGDNGTSTKVVSMRNGELVRGGKGKTTATGTHVPFFAWWPDSVPGGAVNQHLINFNDFFPTLVELANASMPAGHPEDGISLVSTLKGGTAKLRDQQFIHYNPRWGFMPARYVFGLDYKYYEGGEFFDLKRDPGEERPLVVGAAESAGVEKARYEELLQSLTLMPGGPVPSWPTMPLKMLMYIVLGGVVTLTVLLLVLRKFYQMLRP